MTLDRQPVSQARGRRAASADGVVVPAGPPAFSLEGNLVNWKGAVCW